MTIGYSHFVVIVLIILKLQKFKFQKRNQIQKIPHLHMITCDPGCTCNPSKVNPNHLLQMYYYDCHLSFRNVTVMKSSASCLEAIASCVSVTVVSLLPYSASPYSESRFCFCQAFRAAAAGVIAHTGQHTTAEMLLMFSWREGLECVPPHCPDDSVALIVGSFP